MWVPTLLSFTSQSVKSLHLSKMGTQHLLFCGWELTKQTLPQRELALIIPIIIILGYFFPLSMVQTIAILNHLAPMVLSIYGGESLRHPSFSQWTLTSSRKGICTSNSTIQIPTCMLFNIIIILLLIEWRIYTHTIIQTLGKKELH